jgi:hypothetical protein
MSHLTAGTTGKETVMGADPIMSGELYGLILRCEGLLRVCSLLEERGASEAELAEHRRELDRVSGELGRLVKLAALAA